MKFAFIMDPIQAIDIHHDTTFSIMLEAQNRGHEIFYSEVDDLELRNSKPEIHAHSIQVQDEIGNHFDMGESNRKGAEFFDAVFMRKDPPFNMNYVYSTYLLDQFESEGTLVVNSARSLRNCNEKMYIYQFQDLIPPSLISKNPKRIREFVNSLPEGGVVKPIDGFAGRSVFLLRKDDPNLNVIIERMTEYGQEFVMIQSYVPEIKTGGDKRVILIDGKPVGAIARVPSQEDHRGNMAAGATFAKYELTRRDQEICEKLGPRFRADGVVFAGIDIIGDYLTEINLTSPTGFQEVDRLSEPTAPECFWMKLNVYPVEAFTDNYFWILRRAGLTGVVDPGECAPVVAFLEEKGWSLDCIINTHHHFDHVGANLELKTKYGSRVIGPLADEKRIPGIDVALGDGDVFDFGGAVGRVMDVPGHTRGHIAYYFKDENKLFCGDTLFSVGCGRLFEGTPDQMWESLKKIRALPDDTDCYCAHEYTLTNVDFALSIDGSNPELRAYADEARAKRSRGDFTVPMNLGLEKRINPFLRVDSPELRSALGMEKDSDEDVFALVRGKKDSF